MKLRAGDSAFVTPLRRSSPEGSQTQNCQGRVDHHPKFMWCFPNNYVCSIFFTPSVSGAPHFFFPKKKKVGKSPSPRGLVQSHTSKLETYPTSPRPRKGRAAGGSQWAWVLHPPPKTGPKSPPKMMGYIFSHWEFPVYLQNWRFKAWACQPALKMMAILEYQFVQFLVSGWVNLSLDFYGNPPTWHQGIVFGC